MMIPKAVQASRMVCHILPFVRREAIFLFIPSPVGRTPAELVLCSGISDLSVLIHTPPGSVAPQTYS